MILKILTRNEASSNIKVSMILKNNDIHIW